MDPDDFPTTIALTRCRLKRTQETFAAELADELGEHQYSLPLDRFCTNGGGGDDVEIGDIEIDEFTKTNATGSINFTFVESYHSGCRDIDWHESHRATLEFSFDRKTGEIELSGGTSERTYEPDEF